MKNAEKTVEMHAVNLWMMHVVLQWKMPAVHLQVRAVVQAQALPAVLQIQ